MKKSLILLALVLCLTVGACPAYAAEADWAENQWGEDVFWNYDSGTLTFTGTGAMHDCYERVPWDEYREEITTVVFSGEITYIGAYAFADYDALNFVDFGSAMYEIGYQAFMNCDGITELFLPESFKIFGEECLRSCKNLTDIHCQGRFPSFRQNCLWDSYVTIWFPAERPWDVDTIAQLEEAFHGRVEFLASDGTDPYDPVEETEPEPTETIEEIPEETTEEVTEETTEEITEQTEETTEQIPETQTEPVGTSPATEEQNTSTITEEAGQEKPTSRNGSWVGAVIAGSVVAIALLGMLAFGGRKKGGKYRRG